MKKPLGDTLMAPFSPAIRRGALAVAAAVLLAAPQDSHPAAQEAGWRPVPVPGARTAADAPGAGGLAWYRAWVKVDDGFFAKHERNLFEESVGVNITGLAGAHELWVNRRKLGVGGAFPPEYRSGRETPCRHKVPVGTLRKG